MPTLPTFSTDEELAAWINANDTAAYLDEMEDVEEPFVVNPTQVATRPLNIRLRADLYIALEAAARRSLSSPCPNLAAREAAARDAGP